MVRLFSVYHFSGQMVDTIEDLAAMTVTHHNRLLIAQADYTVEVRDLQSEDKAPLFSFPTVDKVQSIIHCASGNYVATLEGKGTAQKSDILIARVYTNWEADFVVNECKKTKYKKRFIRARISGVVTPSSAKMEEDHLDMIEIPVSYSAATLITSCQKTGRLLITSGSTIYLFRKVYLRGYSGKSPLFMDFVPLAQIFHLRFSPISVTICGNVVSANSSNMVSVFRLKEVTENKDKTPAVQHLTEDEQTALDDAPNTNLRTESGALDLNRVLSLVKENKETQLRNVLHSNSFPVSVQLKGINDTNPLMKDRRYPFKVICRKSEYEIKSGKVEDNFIETHSPSKEFNVVAESLLALQINDPDEIISKTALQMLTNTKLSESKTDSEDITEEFCMGNKQRFMCLNFLVTTYQEAFLFYMSNNELHEGLQCVAVFSFTSPVINVAFESCFIHALTHTGIETYNLPTCRSLLFDNDSNLLPCSKSVCVLGIQPFMGVIDFANSDDCITIFTSPNGDEKKGKETLPWTVYSLRLPAVWSVYNEIMEAASLYEPQDEDVCKYLCVEGFVLLQTALKFNLPFPDGITNAIVQNTMTSHSVRLAKLYYRSKSNEDMRTAASIILLSKTDPVAFVKQLNNEDGQITNAIMYLLKKWIWNGSETLTEETAEWIICVFQENNEVIGLAKFLLSNVDECRLVGHKAVSFLKKYVHSLQEKSDIRAIFILCVLYTQQCLQNEASEILKYVKEHKQNNQLFIQVALKYWKFFFEKTTSNGKEQADFSDFTSVLIETLPMQLSEILTSLVKEEVFSLADIVQMLLKQFPCRVSIEKGHLVLQTLLELVFANNAIKNNDDPDVRNCIKILLRSYLTQLRCKGGQTDVAQYKPIFTEKLPDYVDLLPAVENCNYCVLRKIQELTLSRTLSEDIVKEIVESLPSGELKLNVLAMLNYSDFVKELVSTNRIEVILPYAKYNFVGVKRWKEFVNFIHHHIIELKESNEDSSKFEEILLSTLDHLSETMNPTHLSAVLESSIPKKNDLYWKYIMKSQQISYAKDIKELVINTSQQLLQSNTFY